jgi:uridine phosphorylase
VAAGRAQGAQTEKTEKKYHVGLGPGDVGDYVLVPGDPFRTPLIAEHLDDAREVAFSREYRTFTGSVDGVAVSAMSSGMGGPSVAIGVEELHELGVHTLLRVGTCGGLQPEIKMGDLVIAIGSVRSEGTPDGYVPKEYPAIASLDVVNALVEAAEAAGVPYHVGLMRSVDALYSDLVPDQMPRPDLRPELEMWTKAGIIGNDMETSTLLIVSRLRRMRAGTVCLCVDEVGSGEIHHLDPSYMDRMLSVAVDAIRRLIKRDAVAAKRQ